MAMNFQPMYSSEYKNKKKVKKLSESTTVPILFADILKKADKLDFPAMLDKVEQLQFAS
jgi:glutaredoxin